MKRRISSISPPPSGQDSDSDGIDNAYDINNTSHVPRIPDTDSDGLPDYLDRDSDSDLVGDYDEAFDFDMDGRSDVNPSGLDLNGDGMDDAFSMYYSPDRIQAIWREIPASLYCDKVDLRNQIRSINSINSIVVRRAVLFAGKIRSCRGKSQRKQVVKIREGARKFSQELVRVCGGQLYECPENNCSTTFIQSDKVRLQAMARDVAARQKRLKLETIRMCGKFSPKPGQVDRRKNTNDYLRDILQAIGALPNLVTRCP